MYLVSQPCTLFGTLVLCCTGDYAGLIAQLQSKLAMTRQQVARDVGVLTVTVELLTLSQSGLPSLRQALSLCSFPCQGQTKP